MEGMELISFQIIASVGTAKSLFMEAIQESKEGKFDEAERLIKEGEEALREGHRAHSGLIQQEASGEKVELTLLLMHAENQMLTTEMLQLMAEEFIELYQMGCGKRRRGEH